MTTAPAHVPHFPALSRLGRMAALDNGDLAILSCAGRDPRNIGVRGEIVSRGVILDAPLAILTGWACSFRSLADGRRQILDLRLPGDLVGVGPASSVTSVPYTVIALTDVVVGVLPPPATLPPSSSLAQVYATSAAIDNFHLLSSITRLGRLTAYERIADLMLELCDRLSLAGMVTHHRFPMPLTQDTMADMLGLTSVHINRTLQAMRRDGVLALSGGMATLHEPARLAVLADYDRSWLADLLSPA